MSNAATTTASSTPATRNARTAKATTRKASTPRKATTKATPAKAAQPATPKAPAKPSACRCSCGQTTIRPNARYIAGHDARHAGVMGRAMIASSRQGEPLPTRESLVALFGTERLADKALGMVVTANAKANAIAKAKAAKAAAQAAYDKALADAKA